MRNCPLCIVSYQLSDNVKLTMHNGQFYFSSESFISLKTALVSGKKSEIIRHKLD